MEPSLTAFNKAVPSCAGLCRHNTSASISAMEVAIRIHIEQLPEGLFLATSDELPGLVAQGRTVAESLDIARDVARKLIEARREMWIGCCSSE